MGCWNQTCMITHTPIRAGDPVRLVVLIENQYSGGRVDSTGVCYGHEVWTMVGMPVLGEYDDYGRAENLVDGPELQSVYAALQLGWPDADPSAYSGNALCEWIAEGADVDDPLGTGKSRVPTYTYRTKRPAPNYQEEYRATGTVPHVEVVRELRLGYALVHEDVYQAVVAGVDHLDYEAEGRLRNSMTALHDAVPEGLRHDREMRELDERLGLLRAWRSVSNPLFDSPMTLGSGDRLWRDVAGFAAWYERLEDPAWREASLNACLFHYGVGLSRRMYMPQSGQGSQGENYYLHRAVLAAAAGVMRRADDEQLAYQADDQRDRMAHAARELLEREGHVPAEANDENHAAVMALGYRWSVDESIWLLTRAPQVGSGLFLTPDLED
jgi:hypothetical protein